jgi:hypothetical protein
MNKIFVVAISMAFASMVHGQAASHTKAAAHAGKTLEHATVGQPVVPASSTNSIPTSNVTPIKRNGAPACLQGSGPKDNPTGLPCRHVKTIQM